MHFKLVAVLLDWPETLTRKQLGLLTAYYRAWLVRQPKNRLAYDLLLCCRAEARRRRAEAQHATVP